MLVLIAVQLIMLSFVVVYALKWMDTDRKP